MNVLLQELQSSAATQAKFDAFLKCLASLQDDDLVRIENTLKGLYKVL